MSRFLMRPAFRQFRKNWKNRLNFRDAVVHGCGRLILKKSRKTGSRFRSCHRKSIRHIASRSSTFIGGKLAIITRVPLAWTDDFVIIMRRNPSQWVFTTSAAIILCRLDQDLPGPSGILASTQNRSISPTSTSSNSSNSPSGSNVESVGNALDVEATEKDTAQTNKKQHDKWTNEEQKVLINLWLIDMSDWKAKTRGRFGMKLRWRLIEILEPLAREKNAKRK